MIDQCGFCQLDTAGNHEWNCPTRRGILPSAAREHTPIVPMRRPGWWDLCLEAEEKLAAAQRDRDHWRDEARRLANRILRESANSVHEAERDLRDLEDRNDQGKVLSSRSK